MYNFHLTNYYNIKSKIHSLNPLIKIICILLFTLMVLISKTIYSLLILLLFVLILIVLSNISLKLYIKSFKYIIIFILFIFIIDLLFSSFITSIVSVLKLSLFISYSSLIIYTTKVNDLNYGLEKFLTPLKIFNLDVRSISLIITLAIRFIPTLFIEGQRIYKIQISRGLNFNGTLKNKLNKIMSLIIPIFNVSLEKSEDLSNILESKMLSNKRTKYKLSTFTSIDENILIFHIFMLLLLIVKEVII